MREIGVNFVVDMGKFLEVLLSLGNIGRATGRLPIRILAIVCGLGMVLATCLFACIILSAPTRTPLLIISSTYLPPWDINPWTEENREHLLQLGEHNLSVRKLDDASEMARGQWSDLEDSLASLDHFATHDKPFMIYVNLHGVVGNDMQPYFLCKESLPMAQETWIPFDALISRIASATRSDRSLILFLESGRQRPLLPSETSQLTFFQSIRHWMDAHSDSKDYQRLSVIVATNSDHDSMETYDGGGDAFTRFLSRALAGRCDEKHFGGNGNGKVEWSELTRYVHENCESFAVAHRGFPQTPAAYSLDKSNLELTTVAHRSALHDGASPAEASSSSLAEISWTWQQVAALRSRQPWHLQPVAWNRLVQFAVALEAATFGGKSALRERPEIVKAIQHQAEKLHRSFPQDQPFSEAAHFEVTLAWSQSLAWKNLAKSPTPLAAKAQRDQWTVNHQEIVSTPWIFEAATRQIHPIWNDPKRLTTFANLASQIEAIRTSAASLPHLKSLQSMEHKLDSKRRIVEDLLSCGQLDENLDIQLSELERLTHTWQLGIQEALKAFQSQNEICAELSHYVLALDAIQALQDESTATANKRELPSIPFPSIVDKCLASFDGMQQGIQRPSIAGEEWIDLSNETKQLRLTLGQIWKSLLDSKKDHSSLRCFAMRELLRSGLLPIDGMSVDKAVELRLSSLKYLVQSSVESRQVASDSHADHSQVPPRIHQTCVAKLFERCSMPSAFHVPSGSESGARNASEASDNRESYVNALAARLLVGVGIDSGCSHCIDDWIDHQRAQRKIDACWRIMDDFWKTPMVDQTLHFEAVTQKILDDLRFHSENNRAPSDQQLDVRESLLAKKNAAQFGLAVECQCLPQWDRESPLVAECIVSGGSASNSISAGLAQLQIENGGQREASTGIPISVGPQMNQRKVSLALQSDLSVSKSKSRSVAWLSFRGHRFETDFEVRPSRGNTSVGKLASLGPARVLIEDSRPQMKARTLILDCSASMQAPQSLEANTDASKAVTKLDVARLAVANILQRWLRTPDLIGIMLYGHRVAEGTPEQGTLLQNRYYSKFPFSTSLKAFEDVELILPLGRFGEAEWSSTLARLDAIVPWGQTPLYLSIQQAIDASSRIGGTFEHDIIVISDGRNYQFNPTPDKNIQLEQVIQEAKQRGVRIHLIGFGVPDSEMREATDQYQKLATETGGSYTFQIADAVQLVERLSSIVNPEEFKLLLPQGVSLAGHCGTPLIIDHPLQDNTPVWIEYQNRRHVIPLSPRSAIHLLVGNNDHLIVAPHGTHRIAATSSLASPRKSSTPFQISVEQPTVESNRLSWNLSLHRIDQQVPQRPGQIWIEIQPKNQSTPWERQNDEGTYVIADGTWEPDMPLPILGFETEMWPDPFNEAEVRFWCSDQPLSPLLEIDFDRSTDHSISLTNVQRSGTVGSKPIRYQIQLQADSLTFVLLHEDDSTNVFDFMPKMFGLPEMTQVERRYSPTQRLSMHRFRFDHSFETLRGQAPTIPQLRIFGVQEWKQRALFSNERMKVVLRPEIASLPSSPAPQIKR